MFADKPLALRSAESDRLTHVYTLIVKPDQTYEVRIDGSKKESGSLLDGARIA